MDEAATGRRPTRLVLGAVGLFLLAVFLARLLIAGGGAWVVFLLVLPLLVFVLSAAVGFRFALVATALFAVAVLGLRWFLQRSPTGWIALLLLPVVAFTALLVAKVFARLREDRRARLGETESSPEE